MALGLPLILVRHDLELAPDAGEHGADGVRLGGGGAPKSTGRVFARRAGLLGSAEPAGRWGRVGCLGCVGCVGFKSCSDLYLPGDGRGRGGKGALLVGLGL